MPRTTVWSCSGDNVPRCFISRTVGRVTMPWASNAPGRRKRTEVETSYRVPRRLVVCGTTVTKDRSSSGSAHRELNKAVSSRPSRGPRARPRLGAQTSSFALAKVVVLKHQIGGLDEVLVRRRGIWRAHQPTQQLSKHFVLLILGKRLERINQLFRGIRHERHYTRRDGMGSNAKLSGWLKGGTKCRR